MYLIVGVSKDYHLLHTAQLSHSCEGVILLYTPATCFSYDYIYDIHFSPVMQAVLFCQLLVPVDYELAFSILSNHSRYIRMYVDLRNVGHVICACNCILCVLYIVSGPPHAPLLLIPLHSVQWWNLSSPTSGTWS